MKKVALVTSGSSDLELELARRLGHSGYAVYLLARIQERVSLVVDQPKAESIEANGFFVDLLDEKSLLIVRDELSAHYSKLDYLVLDAGIAKSKLFSSYEQSSDLRQQTDINLWGTILPTHIMLTLLQVGSKILMVPSSHNNHGTLFKAHLYVRLH